MKIGIQGAASLPLYASPLPPKDSNFRKYIRIYDFSRCNNQDAPRPLPIARTIELEPKHGRSRDALVHRRAAHGLYVSTGGFTKEARYEADRANVPVRPLDLDTFVRHYVEVYDKTDDETRSILPLTRIWWPA